jgi:hypothetical protein
MSAVAIAFAKDHAIPMRRHACPAAGRMTSKTGTRTSMLRRQQRRTHKYQRRREYL